MGKRSRCWKRCFQLNHRRLHAQPVFWICAGIPALFVFIAAGWMLSGYESLWTSEGVENFLKLLAPVVPWLAFVAAIAALIARMHATVQTEVQIDAAHETETFSKYLGHRNYFYDFVKNESLLEGRDVDLAGLYQSIFPDNSPQRFSPLPSEDRNGFTFFDRRDQTLVFNFDQALVSLRQENDDEWLFDWSRFWICLYDAFPFAYILPLQDETQFNKRRLSNFSEGWSFAERAFLLEKVRDMQVVMGRLAYCSGIDRRAEVSNVATALEGINSHDGFVSKEVWEPLHYSLRNYPVIPPG